MRFSLLAVLLTILLGCERPPQPQPRPTAGPPAPPGGPPSPGSSAPSSLPPGTIEAKDATGVWNQTQVEEFIREDLKLTSMSLKSAGKNDYEGTGADAEGVAYTLKVKQVPGGIRVDWTHPTGHGKITFGNPVP